MAGAEYTYPECTTACVTALSIFKKKYPDYRRAEIERVSKAAIDYVHRVQRGDGSWYGSWGIVSCAEASCSQVCAIANSPSSRCDPVLHLRYQ